MLILQAELGVQGDASSKLRMLTSKPSEHPPVRAGHEPNELFWGVPLTGMEVANPNGPLQLPGGGWAYTL